MLEEIFKYRFLSSGFIGPTNFCEVRDTLELPVLRPLEVCFWDPKKVQTGGSESISRCMEISSHLNSHEKDF